MTRNTLTFSEKTNLVAHHHTNPRIKHQDLVTWAIAEFGKTIGRSTVSRLVTVPFTVPPNVDATCLRRPQHPEIVEQEMEELLLDFFYLHETTGVLSDYVLWGKANEFVHPSQVSMSWVQKFKRRYNIHLRVAHGDAGAVDAESLVAKRAELMELIDDYQPEDVSNFDETGLFFRMLPSQSLASKQIRGRKKEKARITVGLGCNMAGTEKLPPLIINASKQPRCFKGVNIERLGVQYYWNRKAWMTRAVFGEWLHRLNFQMHGRRVLLLIHNASGHEGLALSKIRVAVLPPNTTAYLQPLDAGIIKSFKCKYQKLLIRWAIDQLDADGTADRANVLTAIKFTAEAWQGVTENTIRNCWVHTGIVPAPIAATLKADNEPRFERDLPQLDALIKHLDLDDPLDAACYVDIEDAVPTGVEIVVNDEPEQEASDDDDDDSEDPAIFSHRAALLACQQLSVYAFSQSHRYTELDGMLCHAREMMLAGMKQPKISAYFAVNSDNATEYKVTSPLASLGPHCCSPLQPSTSDHLLLRTSRRR